MLTCPKCGAENPLGRVFCTKCGAKLDLGRVRKEDLEAEIKTNWFASHVKAIVTVIVVLLLIPVFLALWPNARPLTNVGHKQDERYVDSCLKQMGKLRQGQVMPNVRFADTQINALFAESRAKAWGVEMVSFSSHPGYFSARMVSQLLGPWTIAGYQIGLKVSRDITCVPSGKARVELRRATIGHLPLPGPLRTLAMNPILKKAMADPDWPGLAEVSDIKCEQGAIILTVKP